MKNSRELKKSKERMGSESQNAIAGSADILK